MISPHSLRAKAAEAEELRLMRDFLCERLGYPAGTPVAQIVAGAGTAILLMQAEEAFARSRRRPEETSTRQLETQS